MTARLLLFLVFAVLTGCVSGPGKPWDLTDIDILAKDQHFALVRLKRGQDSQTVAMAFYGNPLEAWQIQETNATTSFKPGQVVAVPLEPVNPSSVYPDGFRTLPILCYHQFTHESNPVNRLELSSGAFEEQIRYLVANNYQFLSFSDLAEIMFSGRPVPEKSVVITIDDGYRSVYKVAWPILQKYQAKATLFIYTDFIGAGKALNWSQIKEMATSELIEVQSHGKSHTSLSRLPEDKNKADYRARVKEEINVSGAALRRHIGAKPIYLSYPFGNSSETAARLLEKEGYVLAATVTRGDNAVFTDPFLLHRTMIYNDQDLVDFVRIVRTYRSKVLR